MKTYTKDGINYLVVDNKSIRNYVDSGEDRIIIYDGIKYTFGKSKNTIDISEVTDMSRLFEYSKFNQNISHWNVSNVKNINSMFENLEFNQDLNKWVERNA